jgi:hypothetical protein
VCFDVCGAQHNPHTWKYDTICSAVDFDVMSPWICTTPLQKLLLARPGVIENNAYLIGAISCKSTATTLTCKVAA